MRALGQASAGLPDAPSTRIATGEGQNSDSGTATLSGTVLDTARDVIQHARVTLKSRAGGTPQTVDSGPNGQFSFAGLSPGTYRVTVTGPGMSSFNSPWMTLRAGDVQIVPEVVLSVAAASTSVTVFGDKEELAEQQVKIAEEQRVFSVLPNFYSSYDWNAPPMMAKQKFKLGLRSSIDPVTFVEVAGLAGAQQYHNSFPGFGGGVEGYGKRYAAAYATDFTGHMLTSAVFASLFHEDPRYFYKGTGTIRQRTFYALSAAVMARTDDGRWRPNYAHVLGNFAGGAISNFYYPDSSRGVGLTLENGLIDTAANAATNLIREFVLKGITSHAGGKP